jgi:GNAT superfamily N-acetyltransferase
MLLLTAAQTASLQHWFLPERPGPLVGSHVIQTGQGACWADRWPEPRAVLVETAGNYTLLGDVHALTSAEIQPHIKGFVDIAEAFAPLLRATFPDLQLWPRVILAQPDAAGRIAAIDAPIRRLVSSDAAHLEGLEPGSAWISKTWGGPHGLATSGFGWGAFVGGRLAAVACTFFLGRSYEEIGVVTIPQYRGFGLSTACAKALCDDIHARGHQPSWTTSPDNLASLRVAEKLGFRVQRNDVAYVVGVEIPAPASPPPPNDAPPR